MLTLSGPVKLLFFLCFIAAWTWVSEVCVFSYLCVLCLTVLVNCFFNVFAICVCEVNVFSLNVIVFFAVVHVLCWLIRVWSSIEYVCCVCDHSVCLSICLIGVFV